MLGGKVNQINDLSLNERMRKNVKKSFVVFLCLLMFWNCVLPCRSAKAYNFTYDVDGYNNLDYNVYKCISEMSGEIIGGMGWTRYHVTVETVFTAKVKLLKQTSASAVCDNIECDMTINVNGVGVSISGNQASLLGTSKSVFNKTSSASNIDKYMIPISIQAEGFIIYSVNQILCSRFNKDFKGTGVVTDIYVTTSNTKIIW